MTAEHSRNRKSRWFVMTSIVLAVLISSIDSTITNTTVPHIVKELGGFELYAWSFVAYMITSTVLTPIAGRLSDLFGRKRVFATGMLVFMLGSLLCGSAQTMLGLVLFRAVQGIGAGIMNPFPAIIAGDLLSVEKRGSVQALFSAMWGISAVMAPLLGAVFVEYASWRWIFYVNVPVCIAAILLLIPYKEVYEPRRAPVDVAGAVLFTASISLLLLLTVVSKGLLLYGAAGILLLAVFIAYERKHRSPLIPLSLFRIRNVAWMIGNIFLACAALFGTSSYIPLYMQEVHGYGLFMSGLPLLGQAAGWMLVSVPAGKWVIRYGYRRLLLSGNALLIVCGFAAYMLHADSAFWYVFMIMFVQGLAYGLIFTVTTIGAQELVEPHRKGISTSMMFFSRNIGTAVGTTLMGAFLTKAADTMTGIHQLLTYGFWMSLLAFVSCLFIQSAQAAKRSERTA
ncbi:MDR family MFS transporter [Paenibacillus ginsengarvi]|uniref:MFS-type drug efflux transporter P55 n=1 Tax=Paenibacillus ginsengarvi TaxID=400777 RepID=A0A3B0CN89_9BACL|nr:MDR family MFS transporter [Paenibacillus ginsengarvi]RKN86420.1 MFS transporter [Paenibacillus ginsengarvi]